MRGLIFDKDGTLFDFARSWGQWAARVLTGLADGDHSRAIALGDLIGYDLVAGRFDPASPVIAGTAGQIAALLRPALPGWDQASLVARLNAEAARCDMAPAVSLVPLMARLRARGLRIGLMTNDSEVPARAHLAAAGIVADFDPILGADSGHGAKPSAAPLLECARQWGLEPARIAMVGDSLHDLAAGRAAGMVTVGVLTGMAGADELAPMADVVLADIGGIEGWLDSRS
ncbi:HAD family hydrolase [Paracoccus sp. p4-l81]|uniref:HAD family hydrolase n=1 Tax=unclassified Paracoccus (in: a-proteobacteria) TaxID=2688777 RepID=UPI0035B910EB